jgi:vancomycin permeability regulator SanA
MDDVDAVTGGAGQPPVRTGWSRRRRVLAGCALLVVLAAVPTVWERLVAAPHLRDPTTVPDVPVALVFGARVVGDRPTAFLASRLDLAANLFARRKVRVILVSGNDDGHGYDEPDVMRAYLVAHGVPADRTVVDRGGFDTWDTCARARRVFGVDRAILVTQTFHVSRAVALCRANGVDGYGVGVDSASVGLGSTVYGYFREFFAAGKAMWDALVGRPVPAVLGPADPAVSVALDH